MHLYVMRHGKTIWNEKRRTQGRIHNRLSKSGIEATKENAEKIKEISFDYIFCSPLLRAVQTANIVNKHHNKKIIKDERLTDIDQGYFTGRYFDSLTEEEKEGKKRKDEKYNMESTEDFFLRIKDFYKDLKNTYINSTILIITHSGAVRLLEYVIKHETFNKEAFSKISLIDHSEIKKIL